jgi:hypothetical protein
MHHVTPPPLIKDGNYKARHVIEEEKFKLNVIDYTLVELS